MRSLLQHFAHAGLGIVALTVISFRCGAAEPVCIREHDTTRLATLRIHTCLLGYPAEGDHAAQSIGVRQTLTNVSGKPITLILSTDTLRRAGILVLGQGSKAMHRSPSAIDAPGYVARDNEYVHLAPNEKKELTYSLAEVLAQAPARGSRYFITVRTDYDYRTVGEKDDLAAMRKRTAEAEQRGDYTPSADFHNIEIRLPDSSLLGDDNK